MSGVGGRPNGWWAAAGALATVPLWLVHDLPGRDIPQHLLMMKLARAASGTDPHFAEAWKLVPGSLFYWLGRMLPDGLDPSAVARVALGLGIFGTIAGVHALTRAVHGRSGTAAAYAVLLAYGWHFYEGNLSLLLGIPALLAGLAVLVRLFDPNRAPRAAWTIACTLGVGAFLYLSHLSVFVVFLAAAAIAEGLSLGIRRRPAGTGIAAIALGGLMLAFRFAAQQRQFGPTLDCDFLLSDGFCQPLRWRWPNFDRNLQYAYESLAYWKAPIGVVILAAPLAIYTGSLARRLASGLRRGERTIYVSDARLLLLAGVIATSAALFWVFPDMIPVPGYVRLNIPFGYMVAVLGLALRPGIDAGAGERILAWLVLPIVFLAAVTWVHLRVESSRRPLEAVIAGVPPDGMVLFLDFRRNETPVFQNPGRYDYCRYHLARGGGSPHTFAWYLASPVKYTNWVMRYPPLASPERFRPLPHALGYDAVVLLGSASEIPTTITHDLERWAARMVHHPGGIVGFGP